MAIKSGSPNIGLNSCINEWLLSGLLPIRYAPAEKDRKPPKVPNTALEPDGCSGLISLKNSHAPNFMFEFGKSFFETSKFRTQFGNTRFSGMVFCLDEEIGLLADFFNRIGSLRPFAAPCTKVGCGPKAPIGAASAKVCKCPHSRPSFRPQHRSQRAESGLSLRPARMTGVRTAIYGSTNWCPT